jgi:AraC family transcriptional regulator of arabinose operon
MDWRVQLAIDVMRREMDRPLALTALAQLVNLSPSRFAHLFRQAVGCSPKRYLRDLRLDCAKALAEQSALSIKQIRACVGINDPSHFTRAFTRRHGLSPTKVRARARSPGVAPIVPAPPMSRRFRQQTAETANTPSTYAIH